MGTRSFPGVKCGRGVLLTTHPLLETRSWKSRGIRNFDLSLFCDRYQRVTIKISHTSNCISAWKIVKHGVSQGSLLRQLLLLFYINVLPQIVKDIALPIPVADDSSFIIANYNSMNMKQDLKLVLEITQKWFKSNIMLLNYDKTTFTQFSSNIYYRFTVNTQSIDCKINFNNSIKFLGIIIESSH